MSMNFFSTLICILICANTIAQNGKEEKEEISQFIRHFEGIPSSFFQTTKAKDSILFLLNNNSKLLQAKSINKMVDLQAVTFNRDLLSLELFFPIEQIGNYYFDSVYRNVQFLKKIYSLYLNYPAKNIGSFSSQESVALMYQAELYLYFSDKENYIKSIKSLIFYIDSLYSKESLKLENKKDFN
jgi:hypothetical protein